MGAITRPIMRGNESMTPEIRRKSTAISDCYPRWVRLCNTAAVPCGKLSASPAMAAAGEIRVACCRFRRAAAARAPAAGLADGTWLVPRQARSAGIRRACGCRKSCHPMQLGRTRGSGRRPGLAVEPGRLRLEQVDARVRQVDPAAAPYGADGCCNDRCIRSGPAAGAVHR